MDFLEDLFENFGRKRYRGSHHYRDHHGHDQPHGDHNLYESHDNRHPGHQTTDLEPVQGVPQGWHHPTNSVPSAVHRQP
jgi:hypothetical protein